MKYFEYLHHAHMNYQLIINSIIMSLAIIMGIFILVTKRVNTEKLDSQCSVGFFMLAFAGWLTAGYLEPTALHNFDIAIRTCAALGFIFALHVVVRHKVERQQWHDKKECLYGKLQDEKESHAHFKAVAFHVADKAPELFNSDMLNFGKDNPHIPNFRDRNTQQFKLPDEQQSQIDN